MLKDNPVRNVIRNLRRALNYQGLYEKDAHADPVVQFEGWLKQAVDKSAFEPNAMTLATASKEGMPSARTVLLKDYGPEGFVFYTNGQSRKGRDLAENPRACLVFYWAALSRQVIIQGDVTRLSRRESEEYFHSRPRASQIAACASDQSHAVKDRDELKRRVAEISARCKDAEIPCPPEWGGYRLVPRRIEFWQGRPDRLHDRLSYEKTPDGGWSRQRLAP